MSSNITQIMFVNFIDEKQKFKKWFTLYMKFVLMNKFLEAFVE